MSRTGKRVTRRQFVTLTAGALAASPFINLGRYKVFAAGEAIYSDRAVLGENFRRVLGEIWLS
jgi:hypothetical protein